MVDNGAVVCVLSLHDFNDCDFSPKLFLGLGKQLRVWHQEVSQPLRQSLSARSKLDEATREKLPPLRPKSASRLPSKRDEKHSQRLSGSFKLKHSQSELLRSSKGYGGQPGSVQSNADRQSSQDSQGSRSKQFGTRTELPSQVQHGRFAPKPKRNPNGRVKAANGVKTWPTLGPLNTASSSPKASSTRQHNQPQRFDAAINQVDNVSQENPSENSGPHSLDTSSCSTVMSTQQQSRDASPRHSGANTSGSHLDALARKWFGARCQRVHATNRVMTRVLHEYCHLPAFFGLVLFQRCVEVEAGRVGPEQLAEVQRWRMTPEVLEDDKITISTRTFVEVWCHTQAEAQHKPGAVRANDVFLALLTPSDDLIFNSYFCADSNCGSTGTTCGAAVCPAAPAAAFKPRSMQRAQLEQLVHALVVRHPTAIFVRDDPMLRNMYAEYVVTSIVAELQEPGADGVSYQRLRRSNLAETFGNCATQCLNSISPFSPQEFARVAEQYWSVCNASTGFQHCLTLYHQPRRPAGGVAAFSAIKRSGAFLPFWFRCITPKPTLSLEALHRHVRELMRDFDLRDEALFASVIHEVMDACGDVWGVDQGLSCMHVRRLGVGDLLYRLLVECDWRSGRLRPLTAQVDCKRQMA